MSTVARGPAGTVHRGLVPARMDRLPWSRFHRLVIVGVGAFWSGLAGFSWDRLLLLVSAFFFRAGGAVGWFLGVNAERQSFENVAPPISARGASSGAASAATA